MARKKKRQALYNNEKATWENTAKEQPYLMPGTEEYEERQEDLSLHDPFRPDDSWHEKQEEQNEHHGEALREKADEMRRPEESKRKYRQQMSKMVQYEAARKAAAEATLQTQTQADDMAVREMRLKDLHDVVYDDSVTEDEFVPKVLSKYVD